MTPANLPIHHQIKFKTTRVKFFKWLQSELDKYLSGRPSPFDTGEGKAKRLNFQAPIISGDVLTISRHKLPRYKGKATKQSDLIPLVELEAKPTPDEMVEISIGYLEKEPGIQLFAEAIWKEIISKFQVRSNDRIEFEKLREDYRVKVLLDETYEVEIDSLEDILREFMLFEKAEYLKKMKLDFEKIPDGNTRVKFQFKLRYYGNYGLIGYVMAQPLIKIKTHVQVTSEGWVPDAEEPKRIYDESGKFFESLANHLGKQLRQVDSTSSSRVSGILDLPGENATREDWLLYKYRCDKRKVKFTHEELAKKLNLSSTWTRTVYARWKRKYEDLTHDDNI